MTRKINFHAGYTIDKTGYMMIYRPNHPNCDCKGYMQEHRLIMEQHLGRHLEPEEIVHHIDWDVSNNHIDNLHLFKNNSEHRKYHAFLRKSIIDELGKEWLLDIHTKTLKLRKRCKVCDELVFNYPTLQLCDHHYLRGYKWVKEIERLKKK